MRAGGPEESEWRETSRCGGKGDITALLGYVGKRRAVELRAKE